ncbi:hypothetical protein ABCS02_10035 [Microbacterium sp. X-17]|uniref:hypothetical protein n=1 Tax=Microbacterium sp. X-17 TaxID=3144404 RepID=UPI0031F53AEF
MTLDTLTAFVALVGAVVATLSGVGGLMAFGQRRIDRRFEQVDAQFTDVRREIADVRREVADVKADVVELKVSVARLEGPRPSLMPLR